MQIYEHDTLKSYLPQLDEANLKLLRESIKAEGVKEPLVLWNDFDTKRHWLIDGHHRKAIADELHLEYQTRLEYFDDLDSAKEWMIINQYARRNTGGVPSFFVSELVRIREARDGNKTKTQIVEETARDLNIGQSTTWRAVGKVKMGYENKSPDRDEFDQAAVYADEYNQSVSDDIIEASGFDEYSQAMPPFEQEKVDYVADGFSQVPVRRSVGKKRKKFPTMKAIQKKSLTTLKRTCGTFQSALYEAERHFAGEFPAIDFALFFGAVERLEKGFENNSD